MNDQEMIQSIRTSYTRNQIDYQLKLLRQKPQTEEIEHTIRMFEAALKGM
jgi:hypothetical protein